MTRKTGFLKRILVFALLVLGACASHQFPVQDYSQFVEARSRQPQVPIVEMYGRYSANFSGRKTGSRYSLLLDPGKRSYIEITDPAQKLMYAISLDQNQISLLWAQQQEYIQEPATAENLKAILGLPLLPDDALHLIAGYGINFESWQKAENRKDGWNLSRPPLQAELTMKEHISEIRFKTSKTLALLTRYEDYRMVDNQSLPGSIRFEIPASKLKINLEIEKYLPRDENSNKEMFSLQLPANAKRLQLKDIYRGKPLVLDRAN